MPDMDPAPLAAPAAGDGPDATRPTAPTGPGEPSGQPGPTPGTQAAQPPSRGDARLFKDLDSAERDYKALQGAYTKITQRVASLGDLDSLDQMRAFVQQLQADPEFAEWAQQRLTRDRTGSNDPDTRKALELVQQIADERVAAAIAPLEDHAVAQRLQATFASMDKVDPEWHQYRDKMQEILQDGIRSGVFSPSVDRRFTFAFVKGLYDMAVGSDPEYAARQYQKKLAHKQQQATPSQPGTAPSAVDVGRIRSMDDAFAAAKRQLGLSS